ncbi:cyclic peptide export ABC transporter [Chitinophaga agri]|uniref:Cyclic peptide export ABC transporter n=1 Tax=Chitinophaga agri TaxID=2703787 RepID=A0A6B9ZN17_9BACT|nr:cyclic peptide export ABC transporter [Chitinophaga agri]QHS63367.1 cyclic peptide export ABC transporter [Chitinophaga agri]
MNFLNILLRKFRASLIFILLLGIFNSLLNGGLLIFINTTISGKSLPFFNNYRWMVFTAIIVSSLLCARIFQTYMIRLTNNILFDFENDILRKLRQSSYRDFENLGKEKIYTAINDTKTLAHIPEVFMNAFNAFVVMICCCAYLLFMSFTGGIVVLLSMAALVIFYIVRNNGIEAELNKQRDLQNAYYKYINDLLLGFKELKMGAVRNLNIFNHFLIKNRIIAKKISVETSIRYNDNELTGTYSWYVIFGITMFVLPFFFSMDIEKVTVFLVTILYLMGPVAIMITLIPTSTAIKIAIERLSVFDQQLRFIEGRDGAEELMDHNKDGFDHLEFKNVDFTYYDNSLPDRPFQLKSINLRINRGEVLFITGGNGSGKSTFGYLLTGLYQPDEGEISVNGRTFGREEGQLYRNYFSAVFTDNYLFGENYDNFDLSSSNTEFMELVKLMKMENVLHIDETTRKITTNLSKGQRKRLALIYALLENKPVLVIDEWAAEQDPSFRQYFYTEVLDKLNRRGKTIIAITHDDDYYYCASRVIKFNYGSIVSEELPLVK